MKKLILTFCFLLVFPLASQVNQYISYKHNFQITLPNHWYNIAYPSSKLPSVGIKTPDGTIAGLVMTIEKMDFKETFANFYPKEISELATEIITALEKVHPNLNKTLLLYI